MEDCEKSLLNYFDCAIILLGCRSKSLRDGGWPPVVLVRTSPAERRLPGMYSDSSLAMS